MADDNRINVSNVIEQYERNSSAAYSSPEHSGVRTRLTPRLTSEEIHGLREGWQNINERNENSTLKNKIKFICVEESTRTSPEFALIYPQQSLISHQGDIQVLPNSDLLMTKITVELDANVKKSYFLFKKEGNGYYFIHEPLLGRYFTKWLAVGGQEVRTNSFTHSLRPDPDRSDNQSNSSNIVTFRNATQTISEEASATIHIFNGESHLSQSETLNHPTDNGAELHLSNNQNHTQSPQDQYQYNSLSYDPVALALESGALALIRNQPFPGSSTDDDPPQSAQPLKDPPPPSVISSSTDNGSPAHWQQRHLMENNEQLALS